MMWQAVYVAGCVSLAIGIGFGIYAIIDGFRSLSRNYKDE